jgi:ubiquitin carboxyl-terminal hydrolase L5
VYVALKFKRSLAWMKKCLTCSRKYSSTKTFMDLTCNRKPVYGLIFLFRYQAEDAGEQGEDSPSNVWFANQVANNSCATVALLNMVYNVPSIQLGHELSSFKEQTALMKPARRGEKVSHFDHVRGIHNSFAR